MRSIGIAAKINSPDALAYALRVAGELQKRGLNVCYDQRTALALQLDAGVACVATTQLGLENDLLITFGGDGTLLSVARHAPQNVPIIGVNMGTLGFLTEVQVEEFPALLDRVLSGDYESSSRVTFDVEVTGGGVEPQRFRVVNDAVLNKSALSRMIEMKVSVAGVFVSRFRGDGLIVSTPTGSTAYNLSAGGPIIYPTMRAVVITPICPHMLTHRPIVLSDEFEIALEVSPTPEEIYLTLDGQEGVPVTEEHKVTIRKSAHTICFVHADGKDYFRILRNKLKWGEGEGRIEN